MAKASPVPAHELKSLLVNSLRKAKSSRDLSNYKPLPLQEEFHRSRARGKMYLGGNRAGKTVAGALETVLRLIGEHPFRENLPRPPVSLRCVGVDFDRGVNLIMLPEIKKWMPPKYLINNSWDQSYSKTNKLLTLSNGSTLEFMSYEQLVEKFQGTSRHGIWFDEEPPEDIFKECMMRLVDTDGDWWMSMTPLEEMSWTYNTLLLPAQAGVLKSVQVFQARTRDNIHLNTDALDELTQTLSQSEKETRETGVYISHTGLVYGESFLRDRNVCPDYIKLGRFDEFKNGKWKHVQGFDHGYNNPTAIVFACYNSDGKVLVYDEIYINKTLVQDVSKIWTERIKELGIAVEYIMGDPSIKSTEPIKGSSIQSEYSENGISIGLGNNDVQSGIVQMQKYFKEGQLIISSRCENLLGELQKYRWDRHLTKIRQRKNQKEVPIKKDDHALDALRYLMMTRPRLTGTLEEEKPQLPGINAVRTASDFDWSLVDRDPKAFQDELLGTEV